MLTFCHGLEVSRPEALEPPERASFRDRHAFRLDGIAVVLAVHRDRRREADGDDAWDLLEALRNALECARRLLVVGYEARRNRDDEGLHLLRTREAGIHVEHRDERSDHGPCAT